MNRIPLKAGSFLLSDPFLPDPNFNRTAVYLTAYDANGAVGFVMNRPTTLTLSDVLPEFSGLTHKLFYGGPVEQNTLHFVHSCPQLSNDSKQIQPGVFWGGELEVIIEGIRNGLVGENQIRFFIGYSGWSAGQLDDELTEHAWFVTKAKREYIFHEHPELLWKTVLSNMGTEFAVMGNSPPDLRFN
ncbi:MAG: YqgE/AlgH family protein [Bacteroidia bacterium]|nr:YqgE/AlgH family protein [Bacteroidia bacterium]